MNRNNIPEKLDVRLYLRTVTRERIFFFFFLLHGRSGAPGMYQNSKKKVNNLYNYVNYFHLEITFTLQCL